MPASSDVLIIGGGHNGLVCAAYLAAAGLKVTVLERRHVVGGAAVTEEFHPGFRNSVASYTVSLLNPKVIRDLDLHRHGLRIVERELSNFLPTEDGRYLCIGGGRTKPRKSRSSRAKDAGLSRRVCANDSTSSPTCCASWCWRRRRTSSKAAGAWRCRSCCARRSSASASASSTWRCVRNC